MGSRHASFHQGTLAGALLWPVKLGFALILTLVGVLALAWTIDCVLVVKIWPEGVMRLKDVLAHDLARGIALATWQGLAPGVVVQTSNGLYAMVFGWSGLDEMGWRFAQGGALSAPDTVVRGAYIATREGLEIMMLATQLLGVRVGTLVLTVPLLSVTYLVALVDGLTQRAIRRACGGRESSGLYHRVKHAQIAVAGTGVLATLVWPAPLDGSIIGLALATVVSVLARIQWTCYRKHL